MSKRWKKEELTYLKRYAKDRRVVDLAQRFKTDSATVLLKLKELGLEALDSVEPAPLVGSHQLELFERALKALHAGRFAQSADGFRKVFEESDQPDLMNRARRYLTIAEERATGREDEETAQDPYLLAVYERNRGNFDEALAISSAGGRRSKDPRFAYLVSSIYVSRGDLESAAEYLATAIQLDPMSRIHAVNDADFEDLKASAEHANLFVE
jgi:tetratricopeptide (TPR) repeat protein